jgi:type IV pilus secretin PilQ/predicted competence protein
MTTRRRTNDRATPTLTLCAALLAALAGSAVALAQGQPNAFAPSTTAGPSGSTGQVADPTRSDLAPQSGLSRIKPGPEGETPGIQQHTPLRPPPEHSKVESTAVGDDLVFDLHVNDEDLARVLEMLSIQSNKNIVTSKNVTARVTFNGYGVTFYEALDAILHVNGYGYIEKGNFIYVYTLDEITEMEKALRVKVSKAVRLNYLNAIDAAEFVKPLLSETGQIKTNGKTATFSVGNTPAGADEYVHDATLIVYDFEENVAEIEKLIGQLDTKPQQVLVEATILQTSLNEANAFGVDFSIVGDMDLLDFVGTGGPLNTVNSLIKGQGARLTSGSSGPVAVPGDLRGGAVNSTPGNTSGPATLKLGVYYDDVAVFLRMLDEVTDTTILSNPKILALNRQASRVLVGRKVGYLNTTSTDTATTQTVQFLDTGTQLYFRPFVSSDGHIRMELKPQVSEAIIRDTKDSSGASVTIPDEITNELVTNVMVRDGQTIVLGGLFREETKSARRQVPFLGDIPILGNAFRGFDDSTNRSEIIFLITPTIMNDQVLAEGGERGKEHVERARTGSREGVLPWSRDKMTGRRLVEAERLAAEGHNEQALYKIQQSLRLSPMQPDAIALREKLVKEKTVWPERSGLEEIIRGETQITPGARATPIPFGTGSTTEGVQAPSSSSTADAGADDYNDNNANNNANTTPGISTDGTASLSSSSTTTTANASQTWNQPEWGQPQFDPSWGLFYLAPNWTFVPGATQATAPQTTTLNSKTAGAGESPTPTEELPQTDDQSDDQ